MGQESIGQLARRSQALLMREFERAIERGQDMAVATLVLKRLRKVACSPEAKGSEVKATKAKDRRQSAPKTWRGPYCGRCKALFGREYAALMSRPVENASSSSANPNLRVQVETANLAFSICS